MYQLSRVREAVRSHLSDAVELKRKLYGFAELPYNEYQSSAAIVETLRAAGFAVEYPFMEAELGYGTAFRATLQNGEGAKVAFLCEYDALPEIGHGCGHNLHGPMSALSGLALAELKDAFSGTVCVIGTPAEEENGAKIPMARAGVFDGFDLAVMMHSWSGGECRCEMDLLSLRCYVVTFHGVTAHAVAGPWRAHSALAAARKFLDLVDARRECFTPDVFFNAVIVDGGSTFPNSIPAETKLRLEFRTNSRGGLREMDRIVRNCAQGAALAMDCTVDFEKGLEDFDDMVRVPALEDAVTRLLTGCGEKVAPPAPASGSSDLGNVSYRCPTIQPLLSVTDESFALHTAGMREATMRPAADRAMENGAAAMACLALDVLTDEGFREEVRGSYEAALAKKG